MQIEQAIRDLTTAIDNLSAALRNAKPAIAQADDDNVKYQMYETPEVAKPAEAAAPAPAAPAEPTKEVTEADLRVAAQKLLQAKRLPDILRINKEFGIRRITECPPDRYVALLDALNAALADASGS
ncbi:MAG: hypothetical protein ACO3IN_04585 [Steroidobacteraceae bacterium]